jgi:hypothetical protein
LIPYGYHEKKIKKLKIETRVSKDVMPIVGCIPSTKFF